MTLLTLIPAIVGIMIGVFSGAIGIKTKETAVLSVVLICGFIGIIFHLATANKPEEITQRSYISTAFTEIPGTVINLSEPMRITVSTTKKPMSLIVSYNIATIKK